MMLHHIAFRTKDLECLTRFYEKILELEKIKENPGYSVWLKSIFSPAYEQKPNQEHSPLPDTTA